MSYYQHGDVLPKRVSELPKGAVKRANFDGVIMHGENGHTHTVTDIDAVTAYDFGELVFVVVEQPTTITHQEHGARTLAPGTYYIDQVREHDPFTKEVRRVID